MSVSTAHKDMFIRKHWIAFKVTEIEFLDNPNNKHKKIAKEIIGPYIPTQKPDIYHQLQHPDYYKIIYKNQQYHIKAINEDMELLLKIPSSFPPSALQCTNKICVEGKCINTGFKVKFTLKSHSTEMTLRDWLVDPSNTAGLIPMYVIKAESTNSSLDWIRLKGEYLVMDLPRGSGENQAARLVTDPENVYIRRTHTENAPPLPPTYHYRVHVHGREMQFDLPKPWHLLPDLGSIQLENGVSLQFSKDPPQPDVVDLTGCAEEIIVIDEDPRKKKRPRRQNLECVVVEDDASQTIERPSQRVLEEAGDGGWGRGPSAREAEAGGAGASAREAEAGGAALPVAGTSRRTWASAPCVHPPFFSTPDYAVKLAFRKVHDINSYEIATFSDVRDRIFEECGANIENRHEMFDACYRAKKQWGKPFQVIPRRNMFRTWELKLILKEMFDKRDKIKHNRSKILECFQRKTGTTDGFCQVNANEWWETLKQGRTIFEEYELRLICFDLYQNSHPSASRLHVWGELQERTGVDLSDRRSAVYDWMNSFSSRQNLFNDDELKGILTEIIPLFEDASSEGDLIRKTLKELQRLTCADLSSREEEVRGWIAAVRAAAGVSPAAGAAAP